MYIVSCPNLSVPERFLDKQSTFLIISVYDADPKEMMFWRRVCAAKLYT